VWQICTTLGFSAEFGYRGKMNAVEPLRPPAADQGAPARDIGTNVQLLVLLLKQASLITRPMVEGVADPNGISPNELRIVMCLGGEGALAGHDITEIMGIPPMNVSRALASLLGRGWIEKVRDVNNRRRKPVQLSARGWEAYRALTPDVRTVADYLLGALTANERALLVRISSKIVARMEDWAVKHFEVSGDGEA
jgi:DNA-binding MarR family transcriptional regulator